MKFKMYIDEKILEIVNHIEKEQNINVLKKNLINAVTIIANIYNKANDFIKFFDTEDQNNTKLVTIESHEYKFWITKEKNKDGIKFITHIRYNDGIKSIKKDYELTAEILSKIISRHILTEFKKFDDFYDFFDKPYTIKYIYRKNDEIEKKIQEIYYSL